MKTKLTKLTVAILASLVLSACGGGDNNANPMAAGGPPLIVDANGVSSFSSTALGLSLAALPLEALSVAEKDSLAFMREEEKLAHDVYALLDVRWGTSIRAFGSIANSEATHAEAVRQLLLRYSLIDPAANLAAGLFQNTILQGLNLLKGSRNHLRSFVSNLALQGVTYVPQYMSVADYQLIITTPMERG
jgi:hypothetical protein